MAKYHINPHSGNPGVCRAQRNCPFGDLATEHYSTEFAAREAYENAEALAARYLATSNENARSAFWNRAHTSHQVDTNSFMAVLQRNAEDENTSPLEKIPPEVRAKMDAFPPEGEWEDLADLAYDSAQDASVAMEWAKIYAKEVLGIAVDEAPSQATSIPRAGYLKISQQLTEEVDHGRVGQVVVDEAYAEENRSMDLELGIQVGQTVWVGEGVDGLTLPYETRDEALEALDKIHYRELRNGSFEEEDAYSRWAKAWPAKQRCNCESSLCDHGDGPCFRQATGARVQDVGNVCSHCVKTYVMAGFQAELA